MLFPIGGPLERSLNPAIFEILYALSLSGSEVWPLWCYWSRDHLKAHMPFPIGGPLEPSLYL